MYFDCSVLYSFYAEVTSAELELTFSIHHLFKSDARAPENAPHASTTNFRLMQGGGKTEQKHQMPESNPKHGGEWGGNQGELFRNVMHEP